MTGATPAWRRGSATPSSKPRSGRSCRPPSGLTSFPKAVSDIIQRPYQVLDQVVGMLEAGRKPDQSIVDSKLRAVLRREPLMRCGGWMRDQTFGVAKVVGDADQLEGIEKTKGAFLSAPDLKRAKR